MLCTRIVLPMGSSLAEEIVHHRLTENTDRCCGIHVSFGEECPQPRVPSSNLEEHGSDPSEHSDPVFPSIDNLSMSVGIWRHTLDQRDRKSTRLNSSH